MKSFAHLAVTALLLSAIGSLGAAEEKFSATCPVSGRPASKDHAVNYMGKKVYFCCANCPKAFNQDRKKYAAKANHQLLQTGQIVQVGCPFTGRDLNPDTAIDVKGVKVAFCCNNCKKKAESADDPVSTVFASLKKGFTLQTTCPVSGKPIKPEHSVTYEGKKVYFCCPGCPGKFESNPQAYLKKLPQFKAKGKKAKKST